MVSTGFSILLLILNAHNVLSMECNFNRTLNGTELWHNLSYDQVRVLTDTCRHISRVDDTISQILDAVPARGGNTLLSNIRSYVSYLNSVLNYLKLDKETTKRVAGELLKKGSAKYLAVDTVEEMLRRRFHWTTRDLEIFQELRHDTIETWYDIITEAFND